MNNMLKAGLLSVGTVFFWGLLNVGLRFLVVEYGCHPLALACSNALFWRAGFDCHRRPESKNSADIAQLEYLVFRPDPNFEKYLP